jgi:hypothetical protein
MMRLFGQPTHNRLEVIVTEDVGYLNTRLNHEWILNNNIMQYSSYIIYKSDSKALIESLIIPIKQASMMPFKCVLKYPNGSLRLYDAIQAYPIVESVNYPEGHSKTTTYHVKCEIADYALFDDKNKQSLVAIIDGSEFDFTKNESDLRSMRLSFTSLKYQLPTYIDARQPKKKATAHCIHMLYDLEFNGNADGLAQFFDILIDLKINEIKMYIYRHHSLVDLNLMRNYKFLSVVHHDAVHHRVCQLEIYNLKRAPNSELFKYSYDQCMLGFRKFFQIIEVARVKAIHDKLNTNDCYINFRHLYEIVTNYDYDEFIWPRVSMLGQLQTVYDNMTGDLKSMCGYRPPRVLDAYDYESSLLKRHSNTGSLRLEHVAMIDFSVNLDQFFNDLEQAISNNVNMGSNMRIISYKESGYDVKFTVADSELAYAKQLVQYYKIVRKMSEYLAKVSKLRKNLNRAVALYAPVRLGKSIFDTDRCDLINAHGAETPKSTSLQVTFGFVSHFREFYGGFLPIKNRKTSITRLYIDMEYYHYFFKKFANINCKI